MGKRYRMLPDFKFEDEALERGYAVVIGVDEVGRGALAGPVVAAAVAVGEVKSQKLKVKSKDFIDWMGLGIDDSKRLRPRRREELAKVIKKYSFFGVGEVGVAYINKYGISWATEKAMRQAIARVIKMCEVRSGRLDTEVRSGKLLSDKSHFSFRNLASHLPFPTSIYVLVDAFHVKYVPGVGLKNQKAIVKGDQKSISIAAASIVAKVHRDKLMKSIEHRAQRFKRYGWGTNKGYGTKDHREAIRKHGLTRWYRRKFVEGLHLGA